MAFFVKGHVVFKVGHKVRIGHAQSNDKHAVLAFHEPRYRYPLQTALSPGKHFPRVQNTQRAKRGFSSFSIFMLSLKIAGKICSSQIAPRPKHVNLF